MKRKNRSSQSMKLKNLREMSMIDFCPKCGTLLKVVNNSLPALQCPKCGYRAKLKSDTILGLKLKTDKSLNEIAVIDKETSELRTFPMVDVLCPVCCKAGSETWTVAVGSEGTTSSLTFFRCTSCGYTKREAE